MSTSAAFAGMSAANNAAAQAAAHQAKIERCIVEVGQFNPSSSSVGQKQSYADCISTLYPQDMPEVAIFACKALIVILLAAMIIGAIRGWMEGGIGDACMLSLIYSALTLAAILLLALVAIGIAFLFAA